MGFLRRASKHFLIVFFCSQFSFPDWITENSLAPMLFLDSGIRILFRTLQTVHMSPILAVLNLLLLNVVVNRNETLFPIYFRMCIVHFVILKYIIIIVKKNKISLAEFHNVKRGDGPSPIWRVAYMCFLGDLLTTKAISFVRLEKWFISRVSAR